jgi:hypothetical protein
MMFVVFGVAAGVLCAFLRYPFFSLAAVGALLAASFDHEKEAAIVLASHSLCYARPPVQIIVTISTTPTANMSRTCRTDAMP